MRRTFGFALGLALLVLLAACESAGDGATPGASPTAEPTPAVSPTAEPTGGDSVGLEVIKPVELPDNVGLIVETGCWQCDGPTTGLERVYRDASGDIVVDTLFTPEKLGLGPRVVQTAKGPREEEPTINGFALTADGARMVVGVCTRGQCLELGGPPSADAQTALFESKDGGVTWERVDVLDGGLGVRAITEDGVLLADFSGPFGAGDESSYLFYPSRRPVAPPPGSLAYRTFTTYDGLLLWAAEDGRVVRTDGSEFLSLELPEGAEIVDLLVEPGPAPTSVVAWFQEEGFAGTYYLSVLEPNGDLRHTYRTGDLVLLGGWLGGPVYGNAGVQPEQLPVPAPDLYLGWLPVALDLETGTAAPILDPFLERQSRNLVQAVLEGPFVRVAAGGECLDLQTDPGERGKPVYCLAAGVLLRDMGERREAGGEGWLRVLAPDSTPGWVAESGVAR